MVSCPNLMTGKEFQILNPLDHHPASKKVVRLLSKMQEKKCKWAGNEFYAICENDTAFQKKSQIRFDMRPSTCDEWNYRYF